MKVYGYELNVESERPLSLSEASLQITLSEIQHLIDFLQTVQRSMNDKFDHAHFIDYCKRNKVKIDGIGDGIGDFIIIQDKS